MELERLETDILILGSGGAGLFAALHACKAAPDLDITVATKGLLGKCGCTRMVQGGYNVALHPGDSVERHFMDTIEGGKWLPHQELAWTLVSTAVERVRELENEIGCFFDRNPDGTLHGKAFAGQTFDRTVHKGDLTGIEIISRLMEQVWARPVRRLEEHRAMALVPSKNGELAGVLMIDIRGGEFRFVSAKAVLLATGGGPTMYRYHTPSGDKSMDGLAMALRAGLPLRDMEMVQFHPTGLLAEPDTRMTGTVLEEGLRGAGGHLLDGAMRRFMADYDEKLERATRDVVSRAMYAEMKARRTTPHGGLYIKMGHLGPERVAKEFKGMVERCRDCGFDLAGGLVEVVPTAHFHGRRDLPSGHLDPMAGALRRGRGRKRHAWRQPAGRQRGRQLDRLRRHCGRCDAALDRRQSAAAHAGRGRAGCGDDARAPSFHAQAGQPERAARTAARYHVGRCRRDARCGGTQARDRFARRD